MKGSILDLVVVISNGLWADQREAKQEELYILSPFVCVSLILRGYNLSCLLSTTTKQPNTSTQNTAIGMHDNHQSRSFSPTEIRKKSYVIYPYIRMNMHMCYEMCTNTHTSP